MSGDGRGDRRAIELLAIELLAAHASGGLDPAEAAEVEAHVAAHPEARAELDAIARVLAEVRAAEPRPEREPDWDAMAGEIRRACFDQETSRRSRAGRLAALLPARWRAAPFAARLGAAAAGAAVVALAIVALTRPGHP
ncbi:MAG TPA: hypothetical protein VK698_06250, partial [Kofleriaceae bacterium]|nr:hypothetical protein [Kofleriaceae bacterium]